MNSDLRYIIGYHNQYDNEEYYNTPYFSYDTGEIIVGGKSYGSSIMPFNGFIYSVEDIDDSFERDQILWVIAEKCFVQVGSVDLKCFEYSDRVEGNGNLRTNLIYQLNEDFYHIGQDGNLVRIVSRNEVDDIVEAVTIDVPTQTFNVDLNDLQNKLEQAQADIRSTDEATFYAMADIAKALHPNEAGLFALVAPHGVAGDVTNNLTREQWMWVPKYGNTQQRDGILEVALVQGHTSHQGLFSSHTPNLRRVNATGWDWEHLTNMRYCFSTTKIRTIDTSDWVFHNCLTEIYGIFQSCEQLEAIDVSRFNFEDSQITNIRYMFNNCFKLKTLDVSNWDVSNITNAQAFASGAEQLELLDVSRWDTSRLEACYSMFNKCYNLQELDTSQWTLENIDNMGNMFYYCRKLRQLDLGNCVGSPRRIDYLVYGCTNLEWLNLAQMDTERLTNAYAAFGACPALRHIELGPKFFKTTLSLQFNTTNNLGVAVDGSDNGWLAHLVEVTPTIRAKAGYGDDEDIPLLEEEGGVWYLNDGTARTLQLPSGLKNKAWAPSLISQLQAKGYTIA